MSGPHFIEVLHLVFIARQSTTPRHCEQRDNGRDHRFRARALRPLSHTLPHLDEHFNCLDLGEINQSSLKRAGTQLITRPLKYDYGGYRNKNTYETCKNPRPTSRWSKLTKSCATSTMNFHRAYFSWIPQNARLKLSGKFDESKCIPYWYITLTTSHGMNHVLNEHLDFSQHDPYQCPYAITSVIILWYS